MNYLETGLPHTEFYPRKTEFKPPRFIPLCSLGRKYLGLEPLKKRELNDLINRLSEPKRPLGQEEVPTVKDLRPKSTGTGRFVGEKKMDSFQIEKMVNRLYSRRSTKDFAFVDETVEADDILNMTNRSDDSSDSEDENGNKKGRQSPSQRRKNHSVLVNKRVESEEAGKGNSHITKSTSAAMDNIQKPKVHVDPKPRYSVAISREVSVRTIDNNNVNENVCLKRMCSEGNLPRSTFRAGQSPTPRVEIARMQKNDTRCYKRSKSDLTTRVQSNVNAKLDGESVNTVSNDRSPANKQKFENSKTKSCSSLNLNLETPDDNVTSQPNSPRRQVSKLDDTKVPKLSIARCDELLIDRVATYNRSPRPRCK